MSFQKDNPMASFQAPNATTDGNRLPRTGHGDAVAQCFHAKAYVTSAMTTYDTIQFGYIPPNATATGVTLAADTQLGSDGSPSFTFDVGIVSALQLWKVAVSTVGRGWGAPGSTAMASDWLIVVIAIIFTAVVCAIGGCLVGWGAAVRQKSVEARAVSTSKCRGSEESPLRERDRRRTGRPTKNALSRATT